MKAVDELRPLTAGRLLELWRACRGMEDPFERVLVCNGRIVSECCFFEGERVYENEAAVLRDLTGRQMERLLLRLAEGGGQMDRRPGKGETAAVNPAFDKERFQALGGE